MGLSQETIRLWTGFQANQERKHNLIVSWEREVPCGEKKKIHIKNVPEAALLWNSLRSKISST